MCGHCKTSPIIAKTSGSKQYLSYTCRKPLRGLKRYLLPLSYLGSDKVFLLQDRKGIRPIGVEATKNPWERACQSLGLEKPRPRFHDLRHTWRINARRSGVSDQIAEMILGHALRGKRVDERYGYVSDEELVAAIDKMTFENGTTQILVASARQR